MTELTSSWRGSDDPLWRCGHSKFDITRGAFETPIFQGRGGRRGSSIVLLERATLVSYRLSIVTIALSLTVQPQFAI